MNYNNNECRTCGTTQKLNTRRKGARPPVIRAKGAARRLVVRAAAVIALSVATAHSQLVLQPNEPASKDAKSYLFLPANNFQSNLGVTGSFFTPHEFRSMLAFDLAPFGLGSGDVTGATLDLWVSAIDTSSGGGPGNVALHEIASAWTETGVTWNTFPTFNAAAVDTENLSLAGQWYTYDVTSSVQGWLAAPATNNGWALIPDTMVNLFISDADGVTGASPDPTKAPRLNITTVPEPSSALLIGIAGAMLGFRRRARG